MKKNHYGGEKTMAWDKKGQALSLAALGGLSILLVVGFVTASIGSKVVLSVGNTFTSGTVPANITSQGNQGMQQFAEFAPIIGLVVVAAVVLSIIRGFS
jgi:mannose/fructose/N-acetylgalactosamine-specific phosphotransferase system component IID